MPDNLPEVWLRGPLPGVPPLLQPVAHALRQAREEVAALLVDFPSEKLAVRPLGLASVGFHLRHLAGVLDRTFTYARGEALSAAQLAYLAAEGQPPTHPGAVHELTRAFDQQVDTALFQLQHTPAASLPEWRGGRAGAAAEHRYWPAGARRRAHHPPRGPATGNGTGGGGGRVKYCHCEQREAIALERWINDQRGYRSGAIASRCSQ